MQPESEFSAAPPPKKLRSSKKACVVIHCWNGDAKLDEYKFFILDRESSSRDGDQHLYMKPTIRFKPKSSPVAFCALNSTLYMFEGADARRRHEEEEEEKPAWKFEMTPEILARSNDTYKLLKDKLDEIKSMRHKKFSPKALPTPDGKRILVFSSEMYWEQYWEQGANCMRGMFSGDRIELYDVDQDLWVSAPHFPSGPPVPSSCVPVQSYGFANESHFVIRMNFGIFFLNLETNDWDESVHYDIPKVRGYFLGIDGFYFTPGWTYYSSDIGVFPYPAVSSFPQGDDDDDDLYPWYLKQQRMISPYITLLGRNKDGSVDTGVVKAQRHSYRKIKTKNLLVILDICQTDFEKFKRDAEIYKTEKLKRLKRDVEIYKTEKLKRDAEMCKRNMIFDEDKGEDMPIEEGEGEEEEPEEEEPEEGGESEGEELQEPIPNPSTTIKTFKLLIDFDFYTYFSARLYVFAM